MTVVAVVADDLIWASRLTDAVRRAGAEPVRLASAEAISNPGALDVAGAIVDAALRQIDVTLVVASLHATGLPVLVVADHDDVALRKRALAAGAGKVLAYRKLHEDGPAVIADWLRTLPMAAAAP